MGTLLNIVQQDKERNAATRSLNTTRITAKQQLAVISVISLVKTTSACLYVKIHIARCCHDMSFSH